MDIEEDYEVYDKENPHIYLTNIHQIEMKRHGSFDDTLDTKVTETQRDETMRKNTWGNWVPKRQSEHIYINEVEDEDAYTLARSSGVDSSQANTPENAKKNSLRDIKRIQKTKKNRCIITGVLIFILVAGITGVLVYFTTNQSDNNQGNSVVLKIVLKY